MDLKTLFIDQYFEPYSAKVIQFFVLHALLDIFRCKLKIYENLLKIFIFVTLLDRFIRGPLYLHFGRFHKARLH